MYVFLVSKVKVSENVVISSVTVLGAWLYAGYTMQQQFFFLAVLMLVMNNSPTSVRG